ncbi:ATP-binding cassette domain-containing protein [Nocardioides mesophilus]|uniref:ATP-binding cassette domain-containing protein n=1 Tax=Nocardioides mesophilus TaxID=433659 RepID=A0A7G9R7F2_9ACTN|nr:ATP-binding cassette domain-containing protein [Nocardioides mesophilus]QNN51527.1 ATP-binding cassette domain-containing protein [Nocardioides mesophilus]
MGLEGHRIDVVGLTKTFGTTKALDDLTFSVTPGTVTGFLGPNGAGKTTTLRCLLGLVAPDSGTATVDGRAYRDLDDPIRTVGAALEASDFHPGRTARDHLLVMALGAGLDTGRVDAMLAQVGLTDSARRRVGGFSLGMRQRLALAAALLGDPRVLILDEPANGLDPAGIAWLRGFLRALAAEGRTVLVSSHVLSEVQQTVDEVVVISRGRLVRQGRLEDLDTGPSAVLVRTPTPDLLRQALAGAAVEALPGGALRVSDRSTAEVGHAAFASGVELHELTPEPDDLERLFLDMTGEGAAP